MNSKYNIGDLLVIPFAEKNGIIVEKKRTRYGNGSWSYKIIWFYSTKQEQTETVTATESTIDMWFSMRENKDNANRYYPVVE